MKITQIFFIPFLVAMTFLGSITYAQNGQTVDYKATDTNKALQQPEAAFTIFEGLVQPVVSSSLSNFDSRIVNGEVQLHWMTRTAHHQGFGIERSTDYNNWEKLGYKDAYIDHPAPGEYRFNDLHPMKGVNYYRICQIDKEGKFTYSQTIKVEMSEEDFPTFFKVYPNPANGDMVNIKLPAVVVNGTYLEIYDPTGRQLIRKSVMAPLAELDVSTLTRGVYLMKIQIGQTVWSRKLIVQ